MVGDFVVDVSLVELGAAQSLEFRKVLISVGFQAATRVALLRRQFQLRGQIGRLLVYLGVIAHHHLGKFFDLGIGRLFRGQFARIDVDRVSRDCDHRNLRVGWRSSGVASTRRAEYRGAGENSREKECIIFHRESICREPN